MDEAPTDKKNSLRWIAGLTFPILASESPIGPAELIPPERANSFLLILRDRLFGTAQK
jgi:hypothetical protein